MNIQYAPNFRASIVFPPGMAFEICSHFCHQELPVIEYKIFENVQLFLNRPV